VAPYWGFNPRIGIDKDFVPAIPNMGPLPAHGPTNKISLLAKTHFLLKIWVKHSIDLCYFKSGVLNLSYDFKGLGESANSKMKCPLQSIQIGFENIKFFFINKENSLK
jgi:hypothetical protein